MIEYKIISKFLWTKCCYWKALNYCVVFFIVVVVINMSSTNIIFLTQVIIDVLILQVSLLRFVPGDSYLAIAAVNDLFVASGLFELSRLLYVLLDQ